MSIFLRVHVWVSARVFFIYPLVLALINFVLLQHCRRHPLKWKQSESINKRTVLQSNEVNAFDGFFLLLLLPKWNFLHLSPKLYFRERNINRYELCANTEHMTVRCELCNTFIIQLLFVYFVHTNKMYYFAVLLFSFWLCLCEID